MGGFAGGNAKTFAIYARQLYRASLFLVVITAGTVFGRRELPGIVVRSGLQRLPRIPTDGSRTVALGKGYLGHAVSDMDVFRRILGMDNRVRLPQVNGKSCLLYTSETAEADIQIVDYDEVGKSKGNNINGGNNYGLLTVECLLPEEMDQVKNLVITLKGEKEESITITNDQSSSQAGSFALSEIEAVAQSESDSKHRMDRALEHSFKVKSGSGETQYYPMYVETRNSDGRKILVLLLDSIEKPFSIAENHKSLGMGELTATLIITKNTENKTYSFPEEGQTAPHSYFAGEVTSGSAKGYEIKSIRHLNNVRYADEKKGEAKYIQSSDIYCSTYNGEVPDWEPIGNQATSLGSEANKAAYTWGRQDVYKRQAWM